MTDEMKKYLVIGFFVVCLSVMGVVTYRTFFSDGSAGAGTSGDVALLCTKCGGFTISVKEFQELMIKNPEGNMMLMMPGQAMVIPCPKCSQKTCYIAQKCPQCETIFVSGQGQDQNYPDRCPKCKHSEIEAIQKKQ